MLLPEIKNNDMYQDLREGRISEFNKKKEQGKTCDLTSADFRGLDLKGIDARGLNFQNSYFRQSDLRGVDFFTANLEGSSIHGAKISGVYFPKALSASEILLSLKHGTKMRYRNAI